MGERGAGVTVKPVSGHGHSTVEVIDTTPGSRLGGPCLTTEMAPDTGMHVIPLAPSEAIRIGRALIESAGVCPVCYQPTCDHE